VILTYWGVEGGIYTYLRKVVARLSTIPDIEVHVVALSENDCSGNFVGETVHFLKRGEFRGANYFLNPYIIRKKILEINPDLIHVHTTINSHAIAALMLPKKYPIIVTIHQAIAEDLKSRPLQSIKQYVKFKIEPYLEKKMLEKAEYVIIPSPYLMKYYSFLGSKIKVIPNGVDLEEIVKSKVIKNVSHPSLFFAGRLEKVKGVDNLIKTIPCILKSIPYIHIYIAGSGEEEYTLKKLAENLGVDDYTTFLGFVRSPEIFSYFKSTDICVIPSRFETFGLVILEAMACSKPIVASNVGGIPYLIDDGKNGLLFESENVQDLAGKLIFLLQNEEIRENMAQAGFKKAKEFSWDVIVNMTVELYEGVLGDNS